MKKLVLAFLVVVTSCSPPVSVSTPAPPPQTAASTPLPTTSDVRATATINACYSTNGIIEA